MKQNQGIEGKADQVAAFLAKKRETDLPQAPRAQAWPYACHAAWELCDRRGISWDAREPGATAE